MDGLGNNGFTNPIISPCLEISSAYNPFPLDFHFLSQFIVAMFQCRVNGLHNPVKTVLQEISKSCKDFSLARSCNKSCKCCTKMNLFLQDIKILQESCKKYLQDIFLARLGSNLARKLSYNFFFQDSSKIFISCKSFIFSARLTRYVQNLVQDLARFAYFLQDGF